MTIREFVSSDKETYFAMSKKFYSGTAALHEMNPTHCEATFAACCNRSPYTRGFMLEQDGKALGFALLSFTWSNESGGLVVLLEELYVSEEARGTGVGSNFLDWMKQNYPEATRFRLEVTHANKDAKRLYERNGFELLDYIQMVKDIEPTHPEA